MPSFVHVELDTTSPGLAVEAEEGPSSLFTLNLTSDPDVEDVKVWGAIDVTDPLNGSYAEAEEDADWIPYSASLQVRAAPAGGQIYVRVRDDVWNESEAEYITVGVVVEPPAEEAPRPSGGMPAPATKPTPKVITFKPSVVQLLVEYEVTTRSTTTSEAASVASSTPAIIARVHPGYSPSLLGVELATAVAVKMRASEVALQPVESEVAIHKRREGPRMEQVLIDLDLI
jgi:hypothetical protein